MAVIIFLSAFFLPAVLVGADALTYPPTLPNGAAVVTDTSPEFLRRPEILEPDVTVATTAPRIDFLYYPGQTYPGKPWSVWGDSLAIDGKYYSAIGDHLAPAGNAFVFELDAETLKLRTLVDVKKTLALPAGHYVPGKIHSRIDRGSDGWLYFATHRGSTRVTTDEFHYRGDWILRCHPKTGQTEIVAQGPVAKHCIPTSVLDPDRLIFYGGTAAGNRLDPVQFFAYDVRKRKVLHAVENGPYRYLIFARSTGRVYFTYEDGGPLMRYDPATGKPPARIAGSIGLRAATQETSDGVVYTVSTRGDGSLWRFDTKTETAEKIGNAAVGGQDYVTSIDVDPTGRYLYWVPGAHGGSERTGSPLVQFDVETRTKKVIAFLHPFYQRKYGYTPLGTFGSAVDPSGDRVYITWNGNRGGRDRRGRLGFDTCALTVVHIPESERGGARRSLVFRDVAEETNLSTSVKGMMAHAAAWGDVDADGDLDLFLGTFADRPAENYIAGGATGPVPNRLLIQNEGRFELADSPASEWRGRASGVVFADLDGDRLDDLFVANNGRLGHENRLYRNVGGGRLDDVTDQAGATVAQPETARSATVLDFDGDGRLDLLVLSTVGKGKTRLFRNVSTTSKPMQFEISNAIPGDACGLGVTAGDLTGNGWPDVLVGGPNRLFVNRGDGTFREAKEAGLEIEHTREDDSAACGVAFGDVDRDGRLDVVIGAHTKRPWTSPVALRLLINRGSTAERVRLVDVSKKAGIVPFPMKTPHVEIRDFDNDGWPDIYTSIVVHGDDGTLHPAIYRNLGPSADGVPRFEETAFRHRPDFPNAEDLGPPGRSAAFYERLVRRRRVMYFAPGPSADFDGDGRLDLFLASWFPEYPSLLLKNETTGGNFVDVEVVGTNGVNAQGIGSIVLAYSSGKAGERDFLISSEPIATSSGYCSGQPPIAHLGLGDVAECDLVVVLPHGKGRIVRRSVAAGSRVRVASEARWPNRWIGYTQLRTNLAGGRHANVRTMRARVVKADGSGERDVAAKLVDRPNAWTQFGGWSPDGTIAIVARGWQSPENAAIEERRKGFHFTKDGWQLDSNLVDLESGKTHNVTEVDRVSFYNGGLFFWPGDASKLGFTALIDGNSHPFRMDRDGRNKTDLTRGSEEFTYGFTSAPDGRRIAYHKNYQIFLADADGSNAVKIATGHPFNFGPTWSPDGRWVLFVSGEHYNCHPHIVRADGRGLKKLADRGGYRGVVEFLDVPDFHGGSSDTPVWSADGRSVFFTAKTASGVELFRVGLDGVVEQLTTSAEGTLHYHPKPSRDGRWLLYGSRRAGVRQLFVMRLSDRKERQITNLAAGHGAMWPHWQPSNAKKGTQDAR